MTIEYARITRKNGLVFLVNKEGKELGQVVPRELDPTFVESQIPALFDTPENVANPMKRLAHISRHKRAIAERHQAMLSAAKVDVSAALVKVPERKQVTRYHVAAKEAAGWNACLDELEWK